MQYDTIYNTYKLQKLKCCPCPQRPQLVWQRLPFSHLATQQEAPLLDATYKQQQTSLQKTSDVCGVMWRSWVLAIFSVMWSSVFCFSLVFLSPWRLAATQIELRCTLSEDHDQCCTTITVAAHATSCGGQYGSSVSSRSMQSVPALPRSFLPAAVLGATWQHLCRCFNTLRMSLEAANSGNKITKAYQLCAGHAACRILRCDI